MAKDTDQKLEPIGAVMTPDQLSALIAGITAAVHDRLTSGNSDAMREFMAGIGGMVEANQKLAESFRLAQKVENPNYEDVSVFNFDPRCDVCKAGGLHPATDGDLPRKAHPKPPLRYDVIMCGGPLRAEWLTIAEVELLNSFERDMTARHGSWKAQLLRDGTKTRLVLELPFRGIDVKSDLPPLINILSELLYGETVVDPTQAIALIRKLEDKIADLEKRLPRGTAAA